MTNHDDNDAGKPMEPPPFPPSDVTPAAVANHRPRGHRLVWLVLAAVIVLAGASALTGYLLTRAESIRWAVDDCVALETSAPAEYGCTDGRALYRIVAREVMAEPLSLNCMKHSDATRAVAVPVADDPEGGTVLCLAPTRFNKSDPGSLERGDCVHVEDAGRVIERTSCGTDTVEVISIELHQQIPVTTGACDGQPRARMAFAQSSLGGRAIVVCVIDSDATSIYRAEVGDCVDKDSGVLVPCDSPNVDRRVLTVENIYEKPTGPECLGVQAANTVMIGGNADTDLKLLVCMGPADQQDPAYANVGDCVAMGTADAPSDPRLLPCSESAANYRVTQRHSPADKQCPPKASGWINFDGGVNLGSTICLTRK